MYASRMTSQGWGRSRSSSAGSITWMPVNIRSVTGPSGGIGDRAVRMLDHAAGRVDADRAPLARVGVVAEQQ